MFSRDALSDLGKSVTFFDLCKMLKLCVYTLYGIRIRREQLRHLRDLFFTGTATSENSAKFVPAPSYEAPSG